MADDAHRQVSRERLTTGVDRATNPRGDELTFGSAEDAGFSPVELLPRAVRASHERTCTVSRTVEAAVPVEVRLADPAT
jgi:hypothetical protein